MTAGQRIRRQREALGLSQTALAQAAGVSRALVGAVEADRHAPSVPAALALAAALGATVESLFSPVAAQRVTPVLAQPAAGARVRAGLVGGRLVVTDAGVEGATGWAAADGRLEGDRLHLFPGARPAALVIAGCEPALAVAEALLGAGRLLVVPATTAAALRALAAGSCHAAVVHGRAGALPEPPVPVERRHFARWRVGVATHPDLGVPSLESLLEGAATLVQRPAGAATEQALANAAARVGARGVPVGPLAAGHLEAARRARWERCAAVTFEPAARALALDFLALETHVVELWVASAFAHEPAAQALGELLEGPALGRRLGALDGYDLAGSGRLVHGR